MATGELNGFHYRYEPGNSKRTLLLLHGTGGDENDLIPVGPMVDESAHLLSPRGQVTENGYARFFKRFGEGFFDVEDLKNRADGLAGFVAASMTEFDLDASNVVALGFSNGANIGAGLLLGHPDVLSSAILLRPMVPYEPEPLPDLGGIPVFIGAGRADPIVPAAETERLAELLTKAGAGVRLSWAPGGHSLTRQEIEEARSWLQSTVPTT